VQTCALPICSVLFARHPVECLHYEERDNDSPSRRRLLSINLLFPIRVKQWRDPCPVRKNLPIPENRNGLSPHYGEASSVCHLAYSEYILYSVLFWYGHFGYSSRSPFAPTYTVCQIRRVSSLCPSAPFGCLVHCAPLL